MKKQSTLAITTPQSGRSMIEMLGVLAIIGVLSVGGIAGYTKAMETYKINRLIGQYNEVLYGILEKGSAAWAPNGKNYAPTKSELEALNLFPEDWGIYSGTNRFTDSLKNDLVFNNRLTYLDMDIYIGESKAEIFNTKMCREIFNKFAKPNAKIMRYAGIFRGVSDINPNGSATEQYYGDSLCRDGKKCIRDMTPVVIDNLCKTSCLEKTSCIIFLYFNWPF
jgi:type II secretory pathway pseudopilin PulG